MSKQTAVWTKIKQTCLGLEVPKFLNIHHKTKNAHKKLYKKHEWYRLWTDTEYSSLYHKTLLISVSLIILLLILLQLLSFSNIKDFTPRAQAGSHSVTWTTQGDFENNDVTTDTATTFDPDKITLEADNTVKLRASGQAGSDQTFLSANGSVNDLTYSPSSKKFFSTAFSNHIEYLDASESPATYGSIAVSSAFGSDIDSVHNKLFAVTNLFMNTVSVIDVNTNIEERNFIVSGNPGRIRINPNSSKLYGYQMIGQADMKVFDATTGALIKTQTGYNPLILEVNYGLNFIYTKNPTNASQVDIFNGSNDTLIGSLTDAGDITDIRVNNVTNKVYVAYSSGVINVINSTTNTFVDTINAYSDKMYIDEISNKIFTVNPNDSMSYTIDAVTKNVDASTYLDASAYPVRIAGDYLNGLLFYMGSGGTYHLVTADTVDVVPEGVISGLKVDAGEKPKWSSLSWNGTAPAGTTISFRTRGSDDNLTWPQNWDGPSGVGSNDYYTSTGVALTTPTTRYLEIELRLTSDGTATPTLNDFTINYNTIDPPSSPNQYRAPGQSDQIPPETWVNSESGIYLESIVTCLSDAQCHAEYEIKETNDAFDGQGLLQGSAVTENSTAYSSVNAAISFTAQGSYKWRSRNADDFGRVTPWVEFNNGGTAVGIDSTGPTGGLTIENGIKATNGTDVHLTVEASDNIGGSALQDLPVRFSNNNSDWSDWQAVSEFSMWTLAEGAGEKIVYMQIRDNAGNVTTVNSSIVLDNVPPQIIYDQNSVYPNDGWNVKENINSIEIRVTTDIPSIVYVDYGLNEPNEEAGGSSIFTTSHDILIRQLNANTTYKYRIRAVDELNNMITYPSNADTNNQYFTASTGKTDTGFDGDPLASDLSQVEITASTAKITWKTLLPTTSWVDFGLEATYGSTAGSHLLETTHVVELKNLVAGSTYHYRVRGNDAIDNEYASSDYVFKAVMKPVILSQKIEQITPTTAEISWTTNVRTTGTLSFGLNGSFTGVQKSETSSTAHIVKLTGLLDGMAYKYQVTALDEYGEVATSAVSSLDTPIDMTGPMIKNVRIDLLPLTQEDETAQVVVTWETDKPATSQVFYDVGTIGSSFGNYSIENASLDTTHTVIIKNLTPATSYRFKLVSKDKRNITTESPGYTAATPQSQKTILQLIMKVLEETFSWIGGVGNFWAGLLNGDN